MERTLYWYKGSLHILTSTYTTALTTRQVARKALFPPCLIEHMDIRKALLVKSLQRITNNHDLPQSQEEDKKKNEYKLNVR